MHPSRRMLAALLGLLALPLACGSPGAARLNLGGRPGPPSEPTGELRVPLGGEPRLDPIRGGEVPGNVIAELFSGLVRLDNQANVVGAVAKEVPTVANGGIAADGKTITFSLRQGVYWSDGRPMVADDFVYSIKRQLDPRVRAVRAVNFLNITGARAYATALGTSDQPQSADDAALARLAEAVGARAANSSTLIIELVGPSPLFVEDLGPRNNSVAVRQDVVEAHGDRWTEAGNLIGNGPFVLSEWVHNDHLTLTPNPLYYGQKPRVTKLTFFILEPEGPDWRAYQSGKLDLVMVPTGARAAVLADSTLASQIIRQSQLGTTLMYFNVARPPFDNPRVRQALAKAIDRARLVDALEGVGVPATSLIPPGIPGHNPELGRGPQGFDPAAARRLLADAGFADGRGFPGFSIVYAPSDTDRVPIVEFVKGELRAHLGIDVTPLPRDLAARTQRLASGDFDVFLTGSINQPSTQPWLESWMSGPNSASRYSNPAYERAVLSAQGELDPSNRLAFWQRAHQILVEDSPAIFLYFPEQLWLRQAYVRGLTQCYVGNIPGAGCFSQVWIDKG